MKLQAEKQDFQWSTLLQKQRNEPFFQTWIQPMVAFFVGFCLSAAGLGNVPLPLCLAVLCAGGSGWMPMALAVGGGLGYIFFWGQGAMQPLIWMAEALPVGIFLSEKNKHFPLLIPTLGAMAVAVTGLAFQLWTEESLTVTLYLLRVGLAFGVTLLVQTLYRRRSPATVALAVGLIVLSLAQIAPTDFLNLGFAAAGAISLTTSFPTVIMAGLALDVSGVAQVPMTAVLCICRFTARIPFLPKRVKVFVPALVYLLVMGLCGQSRWLPIPALLVGGLAALLPTEQPRKESKTVQRYVQTRLDTISAVMAQTDRLLREVAVYPLDESALMLRAAERACEHCDRRKNCHGAERAQFLPQALLHQSVITADHLPQECKKKERLLSEMQRSQEFYRLLQADRQRQREYRSAVIQQYGFLAGYLRELADDLPNWEEERALRFRPEVAACSRGREAVNGDRCCWFAGTKGKYYVLLCDGMGTGEEAAYEAKIGAGQMRRMLTAGYPAHEALQTLNSLCVLRACAGAVTVDLAEVDLQNGRVTLYKWGAAPSWLLRGMETEKIGRECLPPGISLEEETETVDKLILQQGMSLIMVSDGVDAASALDISQEDRDQPAGFLAAMVLESGLSDVPDDATVVVLRLHRLES